MESSRKPKNQTKNHKAKIASKENNPILTPQYCVSHHSSEKFYQTEQLRSYHSRNDLSN